MKNTTIALRFEIKSAKSLVKVALVAKIKTIMIIGLVFIRLSRFAYRQLPVVN